MAKAKAKAMAMPNGRGRNKGRAGAPENVDSPMDPSRRSGSGGEMARKGKRWRRREENPLESKCKSFFMPLKQRQQRLQQGSSWAARKWSAGERSKPGPKLVCGQDGPLSHAHIIYLKRRQGRSAAQSSALQQLPLKCLRRDKINVGRLLLPLLLRCCCGDVDAAAADAAAAAEALTASSRTVIHGLLSALCRRTL